MKLLLVDPSFFTLPFDEGLCEGLGEEHEVLLLGRRLRKGEILTSTKFRYQDFFYRWSETLRSKAKWYRFVALIKALEHVIDMVRLTFLIVRTKPDVVHFLWTPVPAIDFLFVWIVRLYGPVVLTVHDTDFLNGGATSKLQYLGSRRILEFFDHLLVLTERAQSTLLTRGISSDRVSVIRHGPIHGRAKSGRFKGPKPDGKTLLQFGLIKAYKGHEILLRAFAKVPPLVRSEWTVLIVGKADDQEYVSHLQNLTSELNISDRVLWDVRFIDESEIDDLMHLVDAYAFPYFQIDESGAFILALGYGKPIVASAVGTFSETLVHRESGLLSEPGDLEGLSANLTTLFSDSQLLEKMGNAARKVTLSLPTWTQAARETGETYLKLLRDRRSVHQTLTDRARSDEPSTYCARDSQNL